MIYEKEIKENCEYFENDLLKEVDFLLSLSDKELYRGLTIAKRNDKHILNKLPLTKANAHQLDKIIKRQETQSKLCVEGQKKTTAVLSRSIKSVENLLWRLRNLKQNIDIMAKWEKERARNAFKNL